MNKTEEKGNENIKPKRNYFAFKPLLIFEDSFDILSILKSRNPNRESK